MKRKGTNVKNLVTLLKERFETNLVSATMTLTSPAGST